VAVTTLGAFSGANSKDKSQRIPAALNALNKALAGDATQLVYMRAQAQGSATAVGKEAFARALAIYDQQKPAPAAPAPAPKMPVAVAPAPVMPHKPVLLPTPGTIVLNDGGGMDAPVIPIGPPPVDFTHPPVIVPTVSVHSLKPGVIHTATIGSDDGGVIAGPPAPEYSGPQGATPAASTFGYTAPPSSESAADSTAAVTKPKPEEPGNGKILLILGIGVVLFFLVDGSLVNHKAKK
jgi:hypothetical protein